MRSADTKLATGIWKAEIVGRRDDIARTIAAALLLVRTAIVLSNFSEEGTRHSTVLSVFWEFGFTLLSASR